MSDSEKTAYQKKMEAKLEKLQAEIQRLQAEIKDGKADTQIDMAMQLQELRQHSDVIRNKLHELRHASGDAWHEVRDGIASAWHDLEAGCKKAREAFKRR